jgi:FlaA1/EpsC-like NDP-sugar epimerase
MRNRYLLLVDIPLVAVCVWGAFTLRFDWYFLHSRPEFLPFVAAALLLKPVVLYAFGMYRRYWRYASVQDLQAVVLAASAASIALAVFVVTAQAAGIIEWFSRSVLFIDWLLTILVIGGVRMSVRVIGESHDRAEKLATRRPPRRVLIAGAGEAGTLVARELQKNPQLAMTVAGFLDDDPAKRGKRISGALVAGQLRDLARVVRRLGVHEVIIAMPTAPGAMLRTLAEACRSAGVVSRTVPGMFELVDGVVSVSRLRRVEIADLLRRRQIGRDAQPASYLTGRTVVVTGAGGSIGFELCRQVLQAGPSHLVLLGHGENSIFEAERRLAEQASGGARVEAVIADIRDPDRLERVFDRFQPQVVFHAAAHKHLPLMQLNPEEAVTNNIFGTRSVVRAAVEAGTERLVLISTDKAVAPTCVMGASKRVAEMIVRDAARRHGRAFVAVRFGNVLGSRGSVVPYFQRQIERGGPITVTHPDMKRFFMTIPEAVHLVLQAGGMALGDELFVLNMGDPVRIVDLARDLVRLSGAESESIPIVYTGIRPGEKLEETLWESGARVEPTANPDVVRVTEAEPNLSVVLGRALDALEHAARAGDRVAIEAMLAQCLPSFLPSAPQVSAAPALTLLPRAGDTLPGRW